MSSLPLYAPEPAARLIGIAKLARQAEHVDSGHEIEFFSLPVRSILNRSDSKRKLPFTWTINPYRGCEFGCKYCYARYTHEFMEIRDAAEFEHKIFVKEEAAWLLRRDLKKVRRGEEIAIGTATDPYQPAERRHRVTRSILEELSRHAGLAIGIVTKSNLVLRDVDVLKRVADQNQIAVHITVTTLNADLSRITEPRRPASRFATCRRPEAQRRRNPGRRNLRAGAAGNHRQAQRAGSVGESGSRRRRDQHLRQSALPKTVFSQHIPALHRGTLSRSAPDV